MDEARTRHQLIINTIDRSFSSDVLSYDEIFDSTTSPSSIINHLAAVSWNRGRSSSFDTII